MFSDPVTTCGRDNVPERTTKYILLHQLLTMSYPMMWTLMFIDTTRHTCPTTLMSILATRRHLCPSLQLDIYNTAMIEGMALHTTA